MDMTVGTRRLYDNNAYEMFIFVLTVLSLVIMVLLLMPLSSATIQLLTIYDNTICVVFLIDFAMRMRGTRPSRRYFIGERGWLDLLGSIPSFGGIFRFAAIFRLARLSRLARITRLLQGQSGRDMVRDVMEHRSQYASFITVLLAFLVLTVASVTVLQFESVASAGNIKTGGEALWWSIVTITTVGYGDYYPVTAGGRITAAFVMFAGVGIIGALASILASVLVGESDTGAPAEGAATAGAPDVPSLSGELAAIRAELQALRATLQGGDAES
jgi:voltage-gated potassium channel